ncbi:hypothetical protein AYK26_00850 [Euryarchaeota archaeon SM23-78]|nr:MAG: hypothetical protein AYK26_00850 [Euryarchaeota archaeon SM23-78]MBW3001421.1 DUF2179 domain-containing protein [Candidatus Woesearchaeota archaeon]
MLEFISPEVVNWIIIPLLICIARIVDVTIGTLRIIYVSKGMRFLAPILGFFEVLIWLLAITQIMKNLTHWIYYVAYALGFGLGTFIGIYVEERISVGHVIIRIITRKDVTELVDSLREAGYRATRIESQDETTKSHIVFTIIKRKDIKNVISIIKRFNPKAFFSVEDVKYVSHVKAGDEEKLVRRKYLHFSKLFQRKGK